MESVETIAEAVLYEGYLLYPYTRTAMKNQQRWTFGGVYPQEYSEATGGHDPWRMQTQCLILGNNDTLIEVKIRFLHVVQRHVMQWIDGSADKANSVDELWVGAEVYRPWEEAIERDLHGPSAMRLGDLAAHDVQLNIDIPVGQSDEELTDPSGHAVGSLVREWQVVQGRVGIHIEPVSVDGTGADNESQSLYRLTVNIVNTTPWASEPPMPRSQVVRHSMISTHTIMHVSKGEFVSLLEPPDTYRAAAEECQNIKTWPVLVGAAGERHTILSSPIILYDYPRVSPQSKGNYYDATEIDELLALSVMTLTDDEKQELRESDPRGREILERTESLSPAELMNLHGSVRELQTLRRDE